MKIKKNPNPWKKTFGVTYLSKTQKGSITNPALPSTTRCFIQKNKTARPQTQDRGDIYKKMYIKQIKGNKKSISLFSQVPDVLPAKKILWYKKLGIYFFLMKTDYWGNSHSNFSRNKIQTQWKNVGSIKPLRNFED